MASINNPNKGRAIKCTAFYTDYHVTVVYLENISDDEFKQANDLCIEYVKSKVKPTFGMYRSEFGKHYQVKAPNKMGDNSVLITGALKTLIENYRDELKTRYPNIYAKMSTRILAPHMNVGTDIAQRCESIVFTPIRLI